MVFLSQGFKNLQWYSMTLDVPDDKTVRLVILRPEDGYRPSAAEKTRAMVTIQDIFENRGTSPRNFRNMLAFIAPDQDRMTALVQETKRYIAWKSVKEDSEDLNLDAAQNRETANSLTRCDSDVDIKLKETYCWLLVPYIDKNVDIRKIVWNESKLTGGTESIVSKAAAQMGRNEELITRWAPQLLKMELDGLLWANEDSISVKTLWECLCKYCYLPRLASYDVLEDTIKNGVASDEFFSLASGKDGERFLNLRYNQSITVVNEVDLLVKNDAARKQLLAKQAEENARSSSDYPQNNQASSGMAATWTASETHEQVDHTVQEETAAKPTTRFYMSAELDRTRIYKNVQSLYDEIISQLAELEGCKISLSLEVSAENGNGFSPDIIRAVSENCRTMNVKNFGFDE